MPKYVGVDLNYSNCYYEVESPEIEFKFFETLKQANEEGFSLNRNLKEIPDAQNKTA